MMYVGFLMKLPQFKRCRFQFGETFEVKLKQLTLHEAFILNKRGENIHSQTSGANSFI